MIQQTPVEILKAISREASYTPNSGWDGKLNVGIDRGIGDHTAICLTHRKGDEMEVVATYELHHHSDRQMILILRNKFGDHTVGTIEKEGDMFKATTEHGSHAVWQNLDRAIAYLISPRGMT